MCFLRIITLQLASRGIWSVILEEKLTNKQVFAFIIIFLIGETLMSGTDIVLPEKNEWLCQVISALLSGILFLSYMRPFRFFPDKNIFEILKTVTGKIIGTVIGLIFTVAAFINGVFLLRLAAEFITITCPENMSIPFFCFMIAVLASLIVLCGISKLGRISQLCFPLLLVFVLFYILASLKNISSPVFLPSFADGIAPFAHRIYSIISCPFSQVIFLISAISMVKSVNKNKKSLWFGFIAGALLVTLAACRNVFILGHIRVSETYFPSYVSASVLGIGDFIKHGEIFVSSVFMVSNIIQTSACIACTCGGISSVCGINYKKLAPAVGFIMLLFSIFIFKNTMDIFNSIKFSLYYFSGIIILIPIIFWIVTEIYAKVKKLSPQTNPEN